ncbi:pimeloyl-ACP methyl ester carboxylesterase [Variovorax paradoxus]|uniref:alpha/beta fold hydrolase n=1 Tax=Variovorax paradoxus TaxID=34073 RepID=UPI003394EEF8
MLPILRVIGTELAFVTAGEASRPAIPLLHGFPSSAREFRNVIPELSQVAHVIAPDLSGFGPVWDAQLRFWSNPTRRTKQPQPST